MLVISQFINIMNQKEEADYKSESFYLCEISWQLAAARKTVEGVIRQLAGLGERGCRRSQVLSVLSERLRPSKDNRAHCSEAAAPIWGNIWLPWPRSP